MTKQPSYADTFIKNLKARIAESEKVTHCGKKHFDIKEMIVSMEKRTGKKLEKTAKVLTTAGRKRIKEKNFALAGGRYPIHDRSHARAALSMVAKHGTPEEQATVRSKVHSKYPGIGKKAEFIKESYDLGFNAELEKTALHGKFKVARKIIASGSPKSAEKMFHLMDKGIGGASKGSSSTALKNMLGRSNVKQRMLLAMQ